jgi:hypothetical protein
MPRAHTDHVRELAPCFAVRQKSFLHPIVKRLELNIRLRRKLQLICHGLPIPPEATKSPDNPGRSGKMYLSTLTANPG